MLFFRASIFKNELVPDRGSRGAANMRISFSGDGKNLSVCHYMRIQQKKFCNAHPEHAMALRHRLKKEWKMCKKTVSPVWILVFLLIVTGGVCKSAHSLDDPIDYRAEMRSLVMEIAAYARSIDPDFIVIPQNGQELITTNGEPDGHLALAYASTIDGQGREDLYYGYDADDTATPAAETDWMEGFLDRALAEKIVPLVTDYCRTQSKVDNSYARNNTKGYLGFAAHRRELDAIPSYPSPVHGENNKDITGMSDAANFLYLLENSTNFGDKDSFINGIDATEYDIFIIDLFYDGNGAALDSADTTALKSKPSGSGGGSRLAIAYFSIGEAEDYRYYWQPSWSTSPPAFIEEENPDWPGNYKVRYWDPRWKAILFGSPDAYLDRIIAAGFDGVYLDIIDAFEYFE